MSCSSGLSNLHLNIYVLNQGGTSNTAGYCHVAVKDEFGVVVFENHRWLENGEHAQVVGTDFDMPNHNTIFTLDLGHSDDAVNVTWGDRIVNLPISLYVYVEETDNTVAIAIASAIAGGLIVWLFRG